MKSNEQIELDDTVKQIGSNLAMWLGIVVCVLCVVALVISSETLLRLLIETEMNYTNDDSDASNLLYTVETTLLEFGIWLKKLPVGAKIAGIVVGGILWISNAD